MTSGHLAIFLGSMVHGAIIVAWQAFKKQQARKPVTMRLKRGVYVPWGPVEKVQVFNRFALFVGGAWFATLACAGLYTWLVGPIFS